MSGRSKLERLSELSENGTETLVDTVVGRPSDEDSPDEDATDQSTGGALTRRTYLVAAAGVASVTAAPAVSAAEGDQYGEGEYGMQAYGGV